MPDQIDLSSLPADPSMGPFPITLPSGLQIGAACPPRLRALLAAGHRVLVQARASSATGRKAQISCATNAHTGSYEMQDEDILPNLQDLLPDVAALAQLFVESRDVQHSRDADGYPFENRFVVVHAPRCDQVVVHLSCGTGNKIDDDTWHQPAALHAANLIRRERPAVVVAAEPSRWSRRPHALGPWFAALYALEATLDGPPFVTRKPGHPEELTQTLEFNIISDLAAANAEAAAFRGRTTRTARARPPAVAVDGVAPYPFSVAPPPPLATAWRLGPTGARECVVFIDTPWVREKLREHLWTPPPQVFEADGVTPVDQLRIFREYAAHRGLPDWPTARLGQHLGAMGLSNEGYRRQHHLAARWADAEITARRAWKMMALFENQRARHFYRTGELWCGVGDRGSRVLAAILLPPDGLPYLTPKDEERIARFLAENRDVASKVHRWALSGVLALVNGSPHRMITTEYDTGPAPQETVVPSSVIFGFRASTPSAATDVADEEDRPDPPSNPPWDPPSAPAPAPAPGQATESPAPSAPDESSAAGPADTALPAARIPALAFVRSMVEGLVTNQADLTYFAAPPDDTVDDAQDELNNLDRLLQHDRHSLEILRAEIFGLDGRPGLDGYLKIDAKAHYEDLAKQAREIEDRRRAAEQELERAEIRRAPRAIAVEHLLPALTTLSALEETPAGAVWRHALRDLTVTSQRQRTSDHENILTEWRGAMAIQYDHEIRQVRFGGQAIRRTRAQRDPVPDLVQQLRDGIPLRGAGINQLSPAVRQRLRTALGVPQARHLPLLSVRDPLLLRIGMAALYPPLEPADAMPTSDPDDPEHPDDLQDFGDRRDRGDRDDPGDRAGAVLLAGAPLGPRRLPGLARRLDVPLDLIKRVIAVTGRDDHLPHAQRRWIVPPDAALRALCTAARRTGSVCKRYYSDERWSLLFHAARRAEPEAWSFERGVLTITPCPWCGSRDLWPLPLRETTQLVCRACRRDRTGLCWPADPYQRYRCTGEKARRR